MKAGSTAETAAQDAFAPAMDQAAEMTKYLESVDAFAASHGEVERFAERAGREFIRRLLQGHYTLRALAERPVRAEGADRVVRSFRRPSSRPLLTIAGPVDVPRLAYQAREVDGLHPMDALLNLPPELYSHEVRRRAAEHAACASFEDVAASLTSTIGTGIGKRQVEELAARAAQDFDDFYAARAACAEQTRDLLVLTFDGKGIPMLREHLRPETRKAAEATPRRLRTRLAKGEERHRKRMAQVAAVYSVAPNVRTLWDVLADL